MNSEGKQTRRGTGLLLGLFAAAGAALGLTLAFGTGPGDLPTYDKLSYENPGPKGLAAPSFSPDSPAPGTPNATYREAAANVHYDASYLAFLLARTAGDESVCGDGCGIPADPDNLTLWLGNACQHVQDSSDFTERSFSRELTNAIGTLIKTAKQTCDDLARTEQSAGAPSPSSRDWANFSSARRASLLNAIHGADLEVLSK